MKLLLDTHAFLWWISDDARLSGRARTLLVDGQNDVFFSAASAWELAIKAGAGRIVLPGDPDRFVAEQVAVNAFQVLPVHIRHALKVFGLPSLHRDPFDRMLVAQAVVEEMPILSADPQLAQYPVEVIW